ncbi:MAG: MoxR family ATPase [Sandaracinaceae bacterium]|nr:MAG: MoxR family ATPase [Sandaracinaceae bacterium]HBQ17995.1 magnesium chelatase [Myxococcales bacterium]
MTPQTIEPETLSSIAETSAAVMAEVQRVYVGPRQVPELLLTSLLARGHVLLEGVPGVAKTTLCKAFAATLGARFARIQFTPDLLPADITGTYVLSPKEGTFDLREGPIFANVLLGDEINRAPAKTQSALLEAMQEQQVTIEGDTRPLPSPFIVLATQNPVEQAGTYPLPEAQIDRFLIRLMIGYPSQRDERGILRRFTDGSPRPQQLLAPEQILTMQHLVDRVHVEDAILDYVVRLATFTREHARLFLGASPRASLALVRAARARALIAGRGYVLPDDVKRLAVPVLAHRLVLTPEAEMEGTQTQAIVEQAMNEVPHRPEGR